MKQIKLILAALVALAALSLAAPSGLMAGDAANPHVVISTRFGDIDLELYPDAAPGHVENFLKLARTGFYNGTIFHRVIPGFMIQGGDPTTKDPARVRAYGTGGPGYTIKAEFNSRPHVRGTLSMARMSDPNSAGSQFFICVKEYPSLDGKYTIFGHVVNGMEAVDRIVSLPRNQRDLPSERAEITVRVIE